VVEYQICFRAVVLRRAADTSLSALPLLLHMPFHGCLMTVYALMQHFNADCYQRIIDKQGVQITI